MPEEPLFTSVRERLPSGGPSGPELGCTELPATVGGGLLGEQLLKHGFLMPLLMSKLQSDRLSPRVMDYYSTYKSGPCVWGGGGRTT